MSDDPLGDVSGYERALELAARFRDLLKAQLDERQAGKTIFNPPGFTVEEWIALLREQVAILTSALNKAGRA